MRVKFIKLVIIGLLIATGFLSSNKVVMADYECSVTVSEDKANQRFAINVKATSDTATTCNEDGNIVYFKYIQMADADDTYPILENADALAGSFASDNKVCEIGTSISYKNALDQLTGWGKDSFVFSVEAKKTGFVNQLLCTGSSSAHTRAEIESLIAAGPGAGDPGGVVPPITGGGGVPIVTGGGLPIVTTGGDTISISSPVSGTLEELIQKIADWIVKVGLVLAVIVFVIIGIQFMASGGNEEKVTKARRNFVYAIIGVSILLLCTSIVQIIRTFFYGP